MIVRGVPSRFGTKVILCLLGLIWLQPAPVQGEGEVVTQRLTDFQSPQGRVIDAQRAAVGERVVYLASQNLARVFELYSVATAGGAVTKLNQPLVSGGDVEDFIITPDGAHVIFRADAEIDEKVELYRVPIAGGVVEKMNGPMVPAGDVEQYAVSPDSGVVLYTANQSNFLAHDLYSHILASGAVAKLSAGLANHEEVNAFEISPDSSQVAWIEGDFRFGGPDGFLRASPVGGGGPIVLETDPVDQMAFTADSSSVVYRPQNVAEWRRSPADGGASGDLLPGYVIKGSFLATSDRSRIFFVGDFDGSEDVLYALDPLTGTATAVSVGGDVYFGFLGLSADDGMLLYCQSGLHAVDTAGGTPVAITDSCPDDEFALSADGSKVAYREFQDGARSLFARPTDGSSPATELAPEVQISNLGRFDFIFFDIAGDHVVFLSEHESGELQLYSVPSAGGVPTRLNADPLSGDSVGVHLVDSSVFYSADQDTIRLYELYSTPVAGGAISKWNDPMLGTGGGAPSFSLSPDEAFVVFRADMREGKPVELWSYNIATGAAPTLLSGPILPGFDGVEFFTIDSTSRRVVYRSDFGFREDRIYSVPIEGGTPVLISDPADESSLRSLNITGEGDWITYFASVGDSDVLRRVPIAGGVVETLVEQEIDRFIYSPGRRHMLFQGGSNPWHSLNLIDGSSFEILPADASWVVYSPAGTRIVYWVDQGFGELYSIPFSGGVATRLNDANSPCNGSSHVFTVSPDSSRVVFWCGGSMYSVPIDGGPVVTLTPFTLERVVISADGSTVLGRRSHSGTTVDLVSVPMLGGPHTTLFSLPADVRADEFPDSDISLDSSLALALTHQDVLEDNHDLQTVPIGGGTPVRLNPENTRVDSFRLSPDGSKVFFVEAPLRHEETSTPIPRSELISAPVGGGELLRYHPQMPYGGRVSKYLPGTRYVLYTANLEQEYAVDLFLAIEASIFADGFESGGLTAWDSSVP